MPGEEHVLIEFSKEQARRGFPLSHRLLKEKANALLHLRKGPNFTVGVNWVLRFLEIHSDELTVYWSSPLDKARANGMNPVAVGRYFDELEELERKYQMPASKKFVMDETGLVPGLTASVQVIGPAGQKIQHKQRDGSQELVTVIETICADGTYLWPTVIFKGKNIMKRWGAQNPCHASIAVSPKGYTDKELALNYLEDLYIQVSERSDGPWMLYVDNHRSHCSIEFLDRAAELGFVVISYPPHTTHCLQGLNVVIFAQIKKRWNEEKEILERQTGRPLTKDDFIQVYSSARQKALTAALIHKAFRKTGAHPVDRTVIRLEEMALSYESLLTTPFPATLPSPVKAVLVAHRIVHSTAVNPPNVSATSEATVPDDITLIPHLDPALFTPSKRVRAMNFLLEKTSASYLVSSTIPLTDNTHLPPPIFEVPPIQLPRPTWSHLHNPQQPRTLSQYREYAADLETDLGRAKAYCNTLEAIVESSNAQLVLSNLENDRLHTTLQEERSKAKNKDKRKGRLAGKRHLMDAEFRSALREDLAAAAAEVQKKKVAGRIKRLSKAKKEWRKRDIESRRVQRDLQKAEFEEAMNIWRENGGGKRRGGKKPMLAKAPARPDTPEDTFFEANASDAEEISFGGLTDTESDVMEGE